MNKNFGIFCHITSLPNEFGSGCISKEAYDFIDLLSSNKISYWQMLPLNPVNYDGSPFQSPSVFAGNPLLINVLDYLSEDDKVKYRNTVNKNLTLDEKNAIQMQYLEKIYNEYNCGENFKTQYKDFEHKNRFWLSDYALFTTIKNELKTELKNFPKEYKNKNSAEVKQFKKEHIQQINFIKFVQFLFFSSWKKLKSYAHKKHVKIIGDIPFYVSQDGADLWAQSEQFLTDKNMNLKGVAGVPPDYFSNDGQLWGNPLYNFSYMKKDNYKWWISRLNHTYNFFDVVKIDHFRGFSSYWKVPPFETTARNGKWIKVDGKTLFDTIKTQTKVDMILEDLGIIDMDVAKLRDYTKFPGMRVYQFGFDGNVNNPHLPQNYIENCVSYIGTHDNNTFVGFLSSINNDVLQNIKNDLSLPIPSTYETITETAIKKLIRSKSKLTIICLQDLLFLPQEYRMNTPGTIGNNWNYQANNMEELRKACEFFKVLIDSEGK